MSKHKVDVKMTFSGSQVNLYLIDDDELAQLKSNATLENPLPYYEIISSDGHQIYSGLDPIDGDTAIEIYQDEEQIDIDGYSFVDDEEEANKLRSSDKNKIIINNENNRDLEGEIPKNMHALVVREFFKSATAMVGFKSDRPVCASDFELIIQSVDNSSDFSEVTYHADILPTESDLVGIVFNDIEVEPDIANYNFIDQELFLFERDASGQLNFVEL